MGNADEASSFSETATAASGVNAQQAALVPGTMLGSYRIGRCLGQGAMGAVYEALHITLGRRAAVKVLLARNATSEELLLRFLREGQAAARIRHPNVVDVYDVGVENHTAFLVMELLEGEDLSALLARDGHISPCRAADVMVPVLLALSEAHECGVVHRDLKPSNVFLAREQDGSITPKVVDFGISKLVGDTGGPALTATSSLLGTPFYMSPEQVASAKDIDARTDVYSAAVILYEALSGRRPFEADSMLVLLTKIHAGEHSPLRDVAPALPRALTEIVERGMCREASRRFKSAWEFATALSSFTGSRVQAMYGLTPGAVGEDDDLAQAPTLLADAQALPPATPKGASSTDAVVAASRSPRAARRVSRPVLAVVGAVGLIAVALAADRGWDAWNAAAERDDLQSRWENLSLPHSEAGDPIPPSTIRFALTKTELLVEGEPYAVATRPLDPASAAFGEPFVRGNSGGMLIPSAVTAASDAKSRLAPHATIAPPALLEIDERTPYMMVVQTAYALGQAGFRTYLFAVETPEGLRCLPNFAPGGDPPAGLPHDEGTLRSISSALQPITLLITGDGVSVKVDGGALAPGCEGIGPGVTVPALGADGERQPILDMAGLTACAQRIKHANPHRVRGFRIAARKDLQFRVLIDVLNAVRKTPDGKPLMRDFSLAVAR